MSTRNFGLVAGIIKADTPPQNTDVLFRASGADNAWPQGLYHYYNDEWQSLTGPTVVPLTNPATNIALNFNASKLLYKGTVNSPITISLDATDAVDGMVRQMVLTGSSDNPVTFTSDFKFAQGSSSYNGQTGIINLVNMQYIAGVGVLTNIVLF